MLFKDLYEGQEDQNYNQGHSEAYLRMSAGVGELSASPTRTTATGSLAVQKTRTDNYNNDMVSNSSIVGCKIINRE